MPDTLEMLRRRATAAVVVNQLRKGMPNFQHQLERELAGAFLDLGDRAERAAGELFGRMQGLLFEAKWRTTLTTAQKEQLIDSIMHSASVRTWGSSKLTPSFEKWWTMTAAYTGRTLVQQGILDQIRPAIVTKMLEAGGKRLGLVDIEGDTRKALLRAIDHGIKDGLGPRETARLIRDIVPEGRFVNAGASYRAQMIARTETNSAMRRSSVEHYRTTQVIQHVVAFDGDGDEECAARNGGIFTLDEAEVEDAITHPNCVLAFGPVAS